VRSIKHSSRCVVALIGLFVFVLAMTGTSSAEEKTSREKGWLGVYLHDVDEEIQEAWDLPSVEGVMIDDVVENSPAANAGLKSGDVVVKVNDQAVTSSDDFSRMIRRTSPDSEIKLEIIRDKKPQQVTVVLGEAESLQGQYPDAKGLYFDTFRGRSLRRPSQPRLYEYFAAGPSVRIGVSLHQLNRQLGEYFGIQPGQGVLVEEVAEESPAEKAGIKAGDVIVEIGGHEVGNVQDILDDLHDYDPGDKVTVSIMRKGARQDFTVTLAEDDEWSQSRLAPGRIDKPRPSLAQPRWFGLDSRRVERQDETTDELRESIRELREELQKTKDELWKALRELQDKQG